MSAVETRVADLTGEVFAWVESKVDPADAASSPFDCETDGKVTFPSFGDAFKARSVDHL